MSLTVKSRCLCGHYIVYFTSIQPFLLFISSAGISGGCFIRFLRRHVQLIRKAKPTTAYRKQPSINAFGCRCTGMVCPFTTRLYKNIYTFTDSSQLASRHQPGSDCSCPAKVNVSVQKNTGPPGGQDVIALEISCESCY